MKKSILLLGLLLSAICYCQEPETPEKKFWSKVRWGGNVGLNFSSNSFNFILAPAAIYQFNPKIATGIGLNFGYSTFTNDLLREENSIINYGGSLIGLYNPIKEIQLSLEFEGIGITQRVELQDQSFNENYSYPSLFVGAGYRMGFVSIGMRYDLLYDDSKSIYANAYIPFVRVFF